MFKYFNPVKIHYGPYLETLLDVIDRQEQEVVLVYGQKSMEKLGVIGHIKNTLYWCNFVEVGGISSNPTIDDIDKYDSEQKNIWVIGIGGGSVLDYAKIIATNKHGQKFIAIPTTSGTGSEVTPWATVWDFGNKKKHSFSCVFAKHAIIDPALTITLPSYITAYTGFDALSHALEAYWSIHANPISDMYALKAIRMVLSNIYKAYSDPEQIDYRKNMSLASLYAGLAFSNTKTTAVHSVSYPMTLYYDIPHGVACSLLLPIFWEYNKRFMPTDKLHNLLSKVRATRLAARLRHLATLVGLPTTLQSAGIPKEGIDTIVKEGFHPDRVKNNPRTLTEPDLRNLLEEIYE